MFFRKPGEDSSSTSEASSEHTEDEETSAPLQDSVLSRFQNLESTASEQPTDRQRPPRLDIRQSSTQNVRDLILHALLEEKAIRQVAEQLGKDESDPDVQKLGREVYQELARQISNNVDDTYAGEDMRNHRATAQDGISRLMQSNLNRLAAVPEGMASPALIARPPKGSKIEFLQQPQDMLRPVSPSGIVSMPALRGYPGLQRDRYAEEFVELGAVGKGGYGKVYKAKHKLDGSLYAIKRIPVSSAKMAKVQEHGPEELENILREVRSLARFDHANVIRYHNAWLEFTTTPTTGAVPKTTMLRTDRLLEDATALGLSPEDTEDIQARLKEMSFADMFEKSNEDHSANIVFGTDHTETSRDEQPLVTRRHNSRRGSQATIATISSTKSRMSAVRDADGEDSDIETIPRSHVPRAQESTTEVSEDMVSHSDMSGSLVPIRHSGPILMLNVQMSLCETNLAALLSAEQPPANAQSVDRHCFHPCISLELLYHIVCGVEYLHAQGVVHRDLKPANVFLSLSNARHPPYGSMDRATCKACPERKCLHITPRIGDFGLVAALDDQCMGADTASKPVGTEFYRPGTSGKISESLDVFALGVVGFELLQKFETRMERVAALTTLRKGEFPADFEQNVGDLGAKVQRLIGDMVSADEEKRASCEEVKMEIAKLVHVLKED